MCRYLTIAFALFLVVPPVNSPAEDAPTPADAVAIKTLPGFKAELVYAVPRSSQGSWVCMAKDPLGRLIVSDQADKGLFLVTPPPVGDPAGKAAVRKLPIEISGAQGLLWAFDSLYINVNGRNSGLYRAYDKDGDTVVDTFEKLRDINGSGEHGPHAITLTPDGKALFVNAGNHTNLPDITGGAMSTDWHEDLLLPRQWDARGHARGRMAPGGWICRVSPGGDEWFVYSCGFRNDYDTAVNRFGDLFAYDADMEWDFGTPWYRPTRVCHAPSGSQFGWRGGTGKLPEYYEDTLPPVLNMGPGSPTGVTFGYGAKFPTKYQDALYLLDWTFGTIYALHLTPSGSSYTAEKEEFASGIPLPLTDVEVGNDGALYFVIGGRSTQSALYRIVYEGSESMAPPTANDPDAAKARDIRRSLEAFHGRVDSNAVETAWPYMRSEDRFLRFAARQAIEAQPFAEWRSRALNEASPQGSVTALIAFARQGDASDLPDFIEAALRIHLDDLTEMQTLALIRAYSLGFIRLGGPDREQQKKVIAQLDGLYPNESLLINREMVQILVYLDAPAVIDRTLALMDADAPEPIPDWAELIQRNPNYGRTIQRMLANHPPTQNIHYAFALRNTRYGWSMDQRKAYFQFINEAGKYPGGASYSGFLTNIRSEALAQCSDAERFELATLTGESLEPPPAFEIVPPKGPGRSWTLEEALRVVEGPLSRRSFANGRNAFHAVGCVKCHRFDGTGGAVGPDITSVRNKFTTRDLLEAMVEPSKVISDQYGSFDVTLKNGEIVRGLVIDVAAEGGAARVDVYTSDVNADPVRVQRSQVASIVPVPVSQMPEDLLSILNEEELRDLVAYLFSRGNPEDEMFK